jgi:hypothetical protein
MHMDNGDDFEQQVDRWLSDTGVALSLKRLCLSPGSWWPGIVKKKHEDFKV